MTEKEILAVLKIGVEGYSMRDIIDNMTDEEVLEWVSACMDAQTIAGIELALKKVKALAESNMIERPICEEDSMYNQGLLELLAELTGLYSSAILSELKNDIKEG